MPQLSKPVSSGYRDLSTPAAPESFGYGALVTELPAQNLLAGASDPWWKLRAQWLYGSIAAGELRDHHSNDDTRYRVDLEPVGDLKVPGGRFVAADPYLMDVEPEPFEQLLGGDTADVVAVRAVIAEGHERVAALVLTVGEGPICDWAMATIAGQDITTLEDERFFGYGVDAGTGSFGSPDAMQLAGQVLHADAGMLDDPISKTLLRDGIGTRSPVVVAP